MTYNRLILIHGYVEDPTIFTELIALLPKATILNISVEEEFDCWPAKMPITAKTFAEQLTKTYAITANDVVIGHSMGGWIAIHIKAITGSTAVQIASFTDQRKMVSPVQQLWFVRFLANTGLLQTRSSVDFIKRQYPFDESRALDFSLLDRMVTMRRAYLAWQMSVLFAPVPPLTVQPDLRIHAKTDNIVRPPDEPHTVVPGDHFCLVFHATEVANAIHGLLG